MVIICVVVSDFWVECIFVDLVVKVLMCQIEIGNCVYLCKIWFINNYDYYFYVCLVCLCGLFC